jgi:hypothetical protein
MADNFLEKKRESYEAKKAEWLRKKKHLPPSARTLHKPDDEAL